MSIGWPNLGGALLLILAGLVLIAGFIGFLVWDARRRRSPMVLVDVTGAVARVWLAFAILGLGFVVAKALTTSWVDIPDLPVQANWSNSLPCDTTESHATATLVCANADSIQSQIVGLAAGIRLLLLAGDVLGVVVAAAPAVAIAVICRQALRGAPFSRLAGRWLLIAAVAVLVAGIGSAIASDSGAALAAAAVLPGPDSGEILTSTGIYRVNVPLWPIGSALGLAALAVVFRHGHRLQTDTEGLV